MKQFDPIYFHLFPSLYRFVCRQRQKGLLFTHGLALVIGLAIGTLLMGYRGKVADENYHEYGRRLNILEQEYEKHHPKSLRTNKAQAQVIVTEIAKAKETP